MKSRFQIVLSYLFLVLFLLPMAEREVHAFAHKDDSHCTSPSEKHLHELEHTCPVCDFNAPQVIVPLQDNQGTVNSIHTVLLFSFKENNTFCSLSFQLSPRAPPTFS